MNPDFEEELKEEQSLFKDADKEFEKFDDPSLQDFIKPDKVPPRLSHKCNSIEELLQIEEEERKEKEGAE